MKVLVIGGGGREHALAWRVAQDESAGHTFCVPGNAGISLDASCLPGNILSPGEMEAMARFVGADVTVVGPEAPLVAGVADAFHRSRLPIVGPTAAAARLEGSKIFTKEFLVEHGIPTADALVLDNPADIASKVGSFGYPVALKADGLAAGKGVVLVDDEERAVEVAGEMLGGELVGDAGRRLLVEKMLYGKELSFMVLTDDTKYCVLPPTEDHKQLHDGDRGPMTGGMGAYCDDSLLGDALRGEILDTIVEPTLAGMRARGTPFSGFLYCGLMLTDEGPKVLEFNVRMGDPETQAILYRLDGDFSELLLSAARGSLDPSLVRAGDRSTLCVVLAAPGYPVTYPTGLVIDGLSTVDRERTKVFHAATKLDGGCLQTAGGRVLTVTSSGSSVDDAAAAAYEAVRSIGFDGMHFRRDIGGRDK